MNIFSRILEKWAKLEPARCESCESLKVMLERQLDINRELTASIINQRKEETIPAPINEPMKPLSTYVPWRVRQQALEAEDRVKAKVMKQSVEELEKEVLEG